MLQQRPRLNNQIRAPQVQVIGPTGEKLGTMALHEALKIAQDQNLDVIEISPTAQPPLVKIIDYGKYQYQKERREKGGGKSASQEVKTVQIGFRTGIHDLNVRSSQIEKFLEKGHRVKIVMRLKGREKGMVSVGKQRFQQFIEIIPIEFDVESPIKDFPGGIGMLIKSKTK